MPIIRVSLLEGFLTIEQKGEVARRMTETLVSVVGEVTRPYIYALVDDVKPGAWSVAGQVLTETMMRQGIAASEDYLAHHVTEERVAAAYGALASGDRTQIGEYWDDELTWLVPGETSVSGMKHGLDEFLAFMKTVGELSGNSFNMEPKGVLVHGDMTADLSLNTGTRAGDPKRRLEIDVVHVMRWRNGKVIEGRGAIFGSGTTRYNEFFK